jgi:hypothetical protein
MPRVIRIHTTPEPISAVVFAGAVSRTPNVDTPVADLSTTINKGDLRLAVRSSPYVWRDRILSDSGWKCTANCCESK